MYRYILRRLALAIPVMLLVALFAFGVIRLIPGDALMLMLAETGNISEERLQQIRAEMGLDRPFLPQFVSWLGGVVRGDFGTSIWTGEPALTEIARALPLTLELGALAILISLIVGLPVGIVSAARRNTPLDYAGRFVAIVGLSVPEFALGILLILALSLWLGWMPPPTYIPLWEDPGENLKQLIFPALVLGFALAAASMRMTRSAMLEVLREDYIRTAWAKGLPERVVVLKHALKNAFIPVITIIGIQLRRLLGSTVVVETVFSLPGLGRLTIDAMLSRDFIQLQSNLLVIALMVVLVNLAVDVSYAWFNPRIRYH
ncbi:MAG: peptide ABC transporter [Candidatus Tectimicrobiota bacterium]|nr:MAG: peptide ABC transporter [Candidatus Tectomicrobia bacterium]